MTTTFLRASEARSKGLTDEELEQLEVAGWHWPEVPKAGPRAEGEPLFWRDEYETGGCRECTAEVLADLDCEPSL